MNEQEIRNIVQDELNRGMFQSGRFPVPVHNHDGTSSLKISEENVISLIRGNGSVDMKQQTTYTFNLGGFLGVPRSITFYGGALNTTLSPKVHAMVVGSAQFGTNQQFQPSTTTSVALGPVIETIIQGSGAMITENAGNTILKNSQGHIIYVEYPSGTIVVQADVIAYSATSIQIQVATLTANWSISGLWIVN